jgi:hypothetical protein
MALQAFRRFPSRRVMLMGVILVQVLVQSILVNAILVNAMVVNGEVPDGMLFDGTARRLDAGFRCVALVGLGLKNQRHGAEMLHNCDGSTGNEPTDDGGKHNRTKDGHFESVAGKCIRMANIVRGVMDGIDMRKANNAYDEQTQSHGQNRLENDAQAFDAQAFTGNRQIGGVRLLHNGPP